MYSYNVFNLLTKQECIDELQNLSTILLHQCTTENYNNHCTSCKVEKTCRDYWRLYKYIRETYDNKD